MLVSNIVYRFDYIHYLTAVLLFALYSLQHSTRHLPDYRSFLEVFGLKSRKKWLKISIFVQYRESVDILRSKACFEHAETSAED